MEMEQPVEARGDMDRLLSIFNDTYIPTVCTLSHYGDRLTRCSQYLPPILDVKPVRLDCYRSCRNMAAKTCGGDATYHEGNHQTCSA